MEKKVQLNLVRDQCSKLRTLGVLTSPDLPDFTPLYTLEPPWRDNERGRSCIPVGEYKCSRYPSKRFGKTFIVMNVPGRDGILFHVGNWEKDTSGCILLGIERTHKSLLWSRPAIDRFRDAMEAHDYFHLVITAPNGPRPDPKPPLRL